MNEQFVVWKWDDGGEWLTTLSPDGNSYSVRKNYSRAPERPRTLSLKQFWDAFELERKRKP